MSITDFWSRVAVAAPDACWLWTGAFDSSGYGKVYLDGRHRGAHRVAYELTHGPIEKGLVLLHSCDNRACCNPNHLTPGTQRDNARDRADKHRSNGQNRAPIGRRYW